MVVSEVIKWHFCEGISCPWLPLADNLPVYATRVIDRVVHHDFSAKEDN
jgi:hypothetical protein